MCISERGKEEGGEKGKGEMGEGYLDRRKIGGKSFSYFLVVGLTKSIQC